MINNCHLGRKTSIHTDFPTYMEQSLKRSREFYEKTVPYHMQLKAKLEYVRRIILETEKFEQKEFKFNPTHFK